LQRLCAAIWNKIAKRKPITNFIFYLFFIIVRHPKVVFVEYTVLNKNSQKALHTSVRLA
jgi:hypothetical protein